MKVLTRLAAAHCVWSTSVRGGEGGREREEREEREREREREREACG